MFLSGFTTKRNILETEYMEITHVIAGSKMELFFLQKNISTGIGRKKTGMCD